MTFATMMVSVDFEPTSKSRIALAAELAARFNALLIGVAGWPLLKGRENTPATQMADDGSAEWVSNELQKLERVFHTISSENHERGRMAFVNGFFERGDSKRGGTDLIIIGQNFPPGDVYHTYDPGYDYPHGRAAGPGRTAANRSS